ncbi:enoyl-ACP reductase FabV [Candidatus Providencia siddallii]|uniref:Enoyl-[acyl-carrier-protein] reductase [NADH] n=1 Tax=Candidatus Providencia siddallii TaxID=1715285 RepID=A0ABP1CGD4_9GAMM
MIIKPKIRGYICTTSHPIGCEVNVLNQISYVKSCGEFKDGPKNALIIGSSTGYGLSSRISLAFGAKTNTIGVFFEKQGGMNKTASAGWYNSASFSHAAKKEGLYVKNINGDAFSDECKKSVIDLCKKESIKLDLIVYSIASSQRKIPKTGKIVRSTLKPIGKSYKTIALDTNKNMLFKIDIKPANKQEIVDTISVMGGEDWELWIDVLNNANLLSNNVKTIAYSYIGSEITWPIYLHGTIGKAKKDLERAANVIDIKLKSKKGSAYIVVLKSVVTQASSAIPVMPLYMSIILKIMKEKYINEGCIEQIQRLFSTKLYSNKLLITDNKNRLRLDDLELRDDVQNSCRDIWNKISNDNFGEFTDYIGYKKEFLQLFGFGFENIDYNVDVIIKKQFAVNNLL